MILGREEAAVVKGGIGQKRTHSLTSILRHFMPCVLNDDVYKTSFLVHDTEDVAIFVYERRLRSLREALDTTPGCILNSKQTIFSWSNKNLYRGRMSFLPG